MRISHCQVMCLSKGSHGLIILFRWAKRFPELRRGDVLMIFRRSGVVYVVEQIGELSRIPQRKANRQTQLLRGRKSAYGLEAGNDWRNVAFEHLSGSQSMSGGEQDAEGG